MNESCKWKGIVTEFVMAACPTKKEISDTSNDQVRE